MGLAKTHLRAARWLISTPSFWLRRLPPWVFMEHPDRDTLAHLIDALGQLTLAGAAIALILPKKGNA